MTIRHTMGCLAAQAFELKQGGLSLGTPFDSLLPLAGGLGMLATGAAQPAAGTLEFACNFVADWEEMAGAVAALAQHQRSSGFREVMDAAEAQQLILLLQRHIAFELAEQAGSRLEARRLLAVAESASRRLCQLAPGRAAYRLKWALDLAVQRTQEAAAAHRAALQAAEASNGELPARAAVSRHAMCTIPRVPAPALGRQQGGPCVIVNCVRNCQFCYFHGLRLSKK